VSRYNDRNLDFHKQTIGVWQSQASSPLSKEAVREITENITGFFETLQKWDEDDRRALDSFESGQAQEVDDQAPTP
jgi:hypothetical protein